MRILLKGTLFTLLVTLFCNAALADRYFQQGVTVINQSAQNIFVTDPAVADLTNELLQTGYMFSVDFASDRMTHTLQRFSHTVNIVSAVDYSPICTVTSNIELSETRQLMHHPESSDESRCATSTYQHSSSNSLVFGFTIRVLK